MTDAPTTNDPVELAMEAEAHDAAPDSPARRLILKQEKLVGWEIADRRAAFGLKLMLGLAALAAAALVAWALWDASRAEGLVVEAFSTPPDLAQQGLTGEVAAGQVMDQLAALQAQVNSQRPAETYEVRGDSDLAVEIGDTGISIEAVQRLLRRWLGHQTRVSGELFRAGGALQLTVRVEGHPAATVTGAETDLNALFTAAAGSVLQRIQPYRYAFVARNEPSFATGLRQLEEITRTGPRIERAWAHLARGNNLPDLAAAAREYAQARRIAPDLALVWSFTADDAEQSGRMEAALVAEREAMRRLRRSPDALHRRYYTPFFEIALAQYAADFPRALRLWTAAEFRPDGAGPESPSRQARLLALLHRPTAAEALLPVGADDVALIVQGNLAPPFALPRLAIARERQAWDAVERQSLALEAAGRAAVASTDGRLAQRMPRTLAVEAWPSHALAMAHLGRTGEAEALIALTPRDCYPCLVARGEVAELARDPRRADGWFAEAARQAPSFADAELAWGRVKLARGDAAGALTLARVAARKTPRYADPLELQGEALLALRDARGAERAFARAADLVPGWGRLHLKWGEALAKLGKADEAKAQWNLAAGLDLTAAERAELAGVMR